MTIAPYARAARASSCRSDDAGRAAVREAGANAERRSRMAITQQSTRARRRVAPHPTVDERTSAGRAARKAVPRSTHREWAPAADRRDPVEMLEEQAATRVPELVPVRYGRMLVSPFTFYRGAAYLMAADLAPTARTGLERPALRRRAPLQLRRLRRARPAARVQRQRLRRDAARARSSGTSSGSSPASPWPAATAASTPSSAPAVNLRGRAGLPRGDARVRAACARSTSGTPGSTSTTSPTRFRADASRQGAARASRPTSPSAQQGQHQGARPS